MESFLIAINAVLPFLIYIFFGYGVKRIGWVDEAFLKKLNQMVFKAFFSVMMFYNMYTKDRGIQIDYKLLGIAVGSLTILIILLVIFVPKIVPNRARQGVIIQAIYRSNTVLFAIPLMENIYGEKGVAIATILIAVMVPIYNLVAVVVLEYYGSAGEKTSIGHILKGIAKNPIIDGAVVGMLFYFLKIPVSETVLKPISQFAAMTTPLALFILGGTLRFKSLAGHLNYIIPTIFVKLILIPAIILVITTVLGFDPISRFMIFCLYGTPVAASSYSMAESMGCDGELAGEIVVTSTAFSVVTIFLWVFLLNFLGCM